MRTPRSGFLVSASLPLALTLAGCASAPRVVTPVLTFEQKLEQVIRLEDRRILRETPAPAPAPPARGRSQKAVPAAPVPDLVALVSDADPKLRRRVALAIGRVGLPEGIPPLTTLLKDVDPDVRQMAAFGMGLIGDRSASPALLAALADTSLVVRGRAAEALGLVGDAASAGAIASMARDAAAQGNVAAVEPDAEPYPAEPPLEAFRLALGALVRLKAYDQLATAVLDANGRPIARWWPIAYALARIEDPRAAPALTELLQGPGRYTRAFAARGVGVARATAALEPLTALVNPAQLDPLVAVSAIRALGQIGGPKATSALMPLVDGTSSPGAPAIDPSVRLEAVTALGSMREPDAAAALMDVVADPWPAMRAQALRGLAAADPNGFIFALSGLDPDPHWSVRAALATALGTLDPAVAGPRLTAMLGDTDRRVVPAVLSALVALKAPDAEAVLRKHLDDADVVIRMTAARELGALKPTDGPQLFADAYRRWSGDATYLARAAALTSLAGYGKPAVPALTEALGDKEWAVRVKALDLLRGIDPAAVNPASIRPVPTAAPVAYNSPDVLAPKFSPHLYVETSKGLIEIELAVQDAPLTAQTLIMLARRGFFTGVRFHRVVPNFVIQGGDPRGDGEGGPNFTVRDERNELPYTRGMVGMALDWRDTGGSQFFITHSPQPHLDARYTIVGRVVKGMDVVDRIQQWDVIERVRVWDGMTLTSR